MTVLSVSKMTRRSGELRERHERQYTIQYIVVTNSVNDGPNIVLSHAQVPQPGTYYIATDPSETDIGARCTDVQCRAAGDDPCKWYVTATFQNIHRDNPNEPEEQEPEDREPQFTIRFERIQRAVEGDYADGVAGNISSTKPTVNSLNQTFVPPVMAEDSRPVLTYVRDTTALDMTEVLTIQDSINVSGFAGASSRTLKLNITDIQERFEHGKRLWRKTYELAYKKQTWDMYVLDRGYIQDVDGNYRTVMLSSDGQETTTPHYIVVKPYRAVDFNTVNGIKDLAGGPG